MSYFKLPKKHKQLEDIKPKPVLKANLGEIGYTGQVTAYMLPSGAGVIIMAASADVLDEAAQLLQPEVGTTTLNRDLIYPATLMSKENILLSEVDPDDEEL